MSKISGAIIGVLAVASLILGVVGLSNHSISPVGAVPGPNVYQRTYFHSGFQSGGDVMATTSTAATYTLLQSEIDGDVTYISWTPNVNLTLTTMASTSMDFVGNNTGDTRTYTLYNASTTAAATITFAAGTGVDLQEAEGGSVIVNGLEGATLTFVRKADSDVMLKVEPWQVGD